jgi:predicted protein tyrosine phosphatase
MVQSVSFLSEAKTKRLRPDPQAAIISITDSWRGEQPRFRLGWGTVPLRLRFDDTETASTFSPYSSGSTGYQAFDRQDAQVIVAWLDRHVQHLNHIYVHCWAGISRSSAVAKFIAQRYDLPFDSTYHEYNLLVYRVLCQTAGLTPVAPPAIRNEEPANEGIF